MAGFAFMQAGLGPLSGHDRPAPDPADRPVHLLRPAHLLAIFAHSFEVLLIARAIQGLGGAAARVLAVAIVRDRFEGRDMARVMSLVFMIFIIVPVIAPATGSLLPDAGQLAR